MNQKILWIVLRVVTLFLIALILLRLYAHAAEPTPRVLNQPVGDHMQGGGIECDQEICDGDGHCRRAPDWTPCEPKPHPTIPPVVLRHFGDPRPTPAPEATPIMGMNPTADLTRMMRDSHWQMIECSMTTTPNVGECRWIDKAGFVHVSSEEITPPKPTPVIPMRERMRRSGFNYAHNVQPGEKLPTPRTNVPPPVPLQFAPGVKPTTDMRPK